MGRKAKPKLTQREQEDEVILKYMNGELLTLEESALALHMYDKAHTKGYKAKKPMTRMGMLKTEQRILAKLKLACEKAGLNKEDLFEMFNHSRHSAATNTAFKQPSIDEW